MYKAEISKLKEENQILKQQIQSTSQKASSTSSSGSLDEVSKKNQSLERDLIELRHLVSDDV